MSRYLVRLTAAVVVAVAVVAGTLFTNAALRHDHATPDVAAARGAVDRDAFHDAMRKLWEDHITWTRLVIVSAITNDQPLSDLDATVNRLLRNQDEIGNAIKPYFGNEAGEELSRLLREHITVAADLLFAAKAGNADAVSQASDAWYRNADEIADFLSAANPGNWEQTEMRAMMKEHLDLTLAEALARLEGNYDEEVAIYDEIHRQILHMADMLSDGIIDQFPSRFRG
jgi:hypothetical protein